MKDIYSQIGIVRTYSEGKVIKVIWDDLHSPEEIYRSSEAQLRALKEEEIEVVIMDVSQSKGNAPAEVKLWFDEVMFSEYKRCSSFRGIVNILPKRDQIKFNSRWNSNYSDQYRFLEYDTTSMGDAEQFAQAMMA